MKILALLAFILVIGITVLIHEAGHFFIARKNGVKCQEFSIGMGPIIKQWKSKETLITLRWLPLGGYVSMVDGNESDLYIDIDKELSLNLENGYVSEILIGKQEGDVSGIVKRVELKSIHGEPLEIDLLVDDELITYPVLSNASYVFSKNEKIGLAPYKESFDSKKIWQRFLILIAGVTMNFILGLLLCIICAFIEGVPNYDTNIIGEISAEGPLGTAGVEQGDKILSVNGKDINTLSEFKDTYLNSLKNNYSDILVKYEDVSDNNTIKTATVTPIVQIVKVGITNSNLYKTNKEYIGAQVGINAIEYDSDSNKLEQGDLIVQAKVLKWDGKAYASNAEYVDINNWTDLVSVIMGEYNTDTLSYSNDSFKISFKYKKAIINDNIVSYGDEIFETSMITAYSEEVLKAQNVSGISFLLGYNSTYHKNFNGCMEYAFEKCGSYFTLVVRTLKVLIAPSNGARTIGLKNMSSVVGIYGMIENYLIQGLAAFLFFVAMLNINIGLMNLLPIPALDGGRILFLGYELLTGKKPNKKIEVYINLISYVLLFALFLYVTFNDVKRLF